jgi:POT family proton-dependent oligopeptide transporter
MDPSAPVKFGFGLIQLGMGFGAFWLGAQNCTAVGMVGISWLTLGILLQTTGELCLSPVGLSTMTKLSPKILVSTLMGAWFLATAFSQYLAAIISNLTSVGGHGGGAGADLPAPINTVNVYGDVFGTIALTAMACGGVCILMSPLLKYWMHEDKIIDEDGNLIGSTKDQKTEA